MHSQGSRVLLSGVGGDEFNGGVPSHAPELADLLFEMKWRRFLHQLQLWALHHRKPWPQILMAVAGKFLPFPGLPAGQEPGATGWLNAGFARRHRRALSGYQDRWNIVGPRPSLQDHNDTLLAMRRQLSVELPASNPVYEKRYPYLDRNFLEFVSAIPPDQLVRPGQRRSLMRRAVRGIVPDKVLDRKRKAHVVRGPMLAILSNSTLVSDLCNDMVTAALGVVDQGAINAALEKVQHGCSIALVPFLRTLAMEGWLRSLLPSGIVRIDEAVAAANSRHVHPSCYIP